MKSKLPWDLPWIWNRTEERESFEGLFRRIRRSPALASAVVFDPAGPDVASWLRRVGFVLSTSDDESFHLAPAEGMASGAVPALLGWPGADTIYDRRWIHASPSAMAAKIAQIVDEGRWEEERMLGTRGGTPVLRPRPGLRPLGGAAHVRPGRRSGVNAHDMSGSSAQCRTLRTGGVHSSVASNAPHAIVDSIPASVCRNGRVVPAHVLHELGEEAVQEVRVERRRRRGPVNHVCVRPAPSRGTPRPGWPRRSSGRGAPRADQVVHVHVGVAAAPVDPLGGHVPVGDEQRERERRDERQRAEDPRRRRLQQLEVLRA